MKSLLKSLGILATFIVMGALVVSKLGELFPAMDAIAWGIVLAGFGFSIFLAIKSEVWVEKLWPGRFSEDQSMWLCIIGVFVIGSIVMYLGWDIVGRFLTEHFGPAVR